MTPQERKEAYKAKQRAAEAARRKSLGLPDWPPAPKPARSKERRATDRDPRPVYGSQDWAETYRDDLGESPDY